MMSRNKAENSAKKGSLGHFQKRLDSVSRRVDEFYNHLDRSSSITSPDRKQNYSKCDKLKSEIELLSGQVSSLSKDDESSSIQAFEEQKKKERQRLEKLKSKLDRISEQLEPDEIEDDYFRKMQDGGEVGASNSDLVSENAADVEDNKAESEEDEDDDDDDDEYEDDSEEEDTVSKTIVVHKVEALSNFPGDQDGDLSFKKGDILTVLETREDGWWLAENAAGKQGVAPKTLLKILDDAEESSPEKHKDDSSVIGREAADKVPELPRQRSGKDLWKTLEKGTKRETSATDVLKAMGAMPSGFRSTTLGKMVKQEIWQTSSWVIPKLSESNVAFKDITWDPVHKQLKPRTVKTNRLFQVLSARMIPLPGAGIDVLSRHVRIVIWDLNKKQAFSNVLSVRATASDKDPSTWTFTPKAASSVFDSECLARINSNDDSLAILFELNMLYTRLSTGEKSEVTCGWCVMRLFEENGSPVPNKTNEIQLNGGTPFDVGVDLDPSISLKASTNRFQQVIRSNRQPRLSVKLVSLQRREMYDMLPDTLLTCHVYAQFISLYRQLLTEAIMHEGRNQQEADLIMDPVIATFPKILYTTDVMDALKRCWDEKSKREVKRSQRRDGAYMRRFFREVYMDSVFPITNSAEIPAYIWGDDQRELARLRWIQSYCDKRTALENLLSPDRVYKPFNLDRLYLDLCSKHATT